MSKKIITKAPAKKLFGKLTRIFVEKPAVNSEPSQDGNRRIEASELFSLFTADIIKEDIVFTR
jgi:hypothetical protein